MSVCVCVFLCFGARLGNQSVNQSVNPKQPTKPTAITTDCGAGIGRVTKHLLLPLFEKVDLLEQSPRLLAAAPAYLSSAVAAASAATPAAAAAAEKKEGQEAGQEAAAATGAAAMSRDELAGRVTYMCAGMQDFAAAEGAYDVVWIQWCVGHLHDLDLLRFLQRCKRALVRPGRGQGCVVVKDNCCSDVDFVLDKDDSSVTRSPAYLKALFRIAGFDVRLEERQDGFPAELLPVYMFAFTPRSF
jgi:protein N-terminal methyltransferase